jgi:hypothetical protein
VIERERDERICVLVCCLKCGMHSLNQNLWQVYVGYVCVFCGSAFTSAAGAQGHMQAKGHCRMAAAPEAFVEEYARFYLSPPLDSATASAATHKSASGTHAADASASGGVRDGVFGVQVTAAESSIEIEAVSFPSPTSTLSTHTHTHTHTQTTHIFVY